jgi:hypothetical protein
MSFLKECFTPNQYLAYYEPQLNNQLGQSCQDPQAGRGEQIRCWFIEMAYPHSFTAVNSLFNDPLNVRQEIRVTRETPKDNHTKLTSIGIINDCTLASSKIK